MVKQLLKGGGNLAGPQADGTLPVGMCVYGLSAKIIVPSRFDVVAWGLLEIPGLSAVEYTVLLS